VIHSIRATFLTLGNYVVGMAGTILLGWLELKQKIWIC
jgi:hypothetical protein